MAGRKQHFIPQVVQRAFEAARSGTKSQVFVFRKGRSAYLTATDGAGAERDFYSNPLIDGEGALDDKITDFEGGHLAPMLRELRLSEGGEADPELAAITVAHLAFRTAHLRSAMAGMMEGAVGQMQSLLDIPDALRRFAEIDSMSSNSRLSELIRDDIAKLTSNVTSEKDRQTLERIVTFRVRERFDELVLQAHGTMRDGLEALGSNFSDSIPRAHARALSESLVPQGRVRALRQLNWHIVTADSQARHFILPDCVVAARSATSGQINAFATLSSDEAELVVMPLSSRQLLVGSKAVAPVQQVEINLQLARCSIEFFISSKNDEATDAIAASIGACAAGLEIELFEEDDAGLDTSPTPVLRNPRRLVVRTPVGKFGTVAKSVISKIAEGATEQTTADRIDSITVAANMKGALEAIWKRPPTVEELQAAAFGTVEPVKVGVEWKCRVIVPREMAEILVQARDPNRHLFATRMLKHSLGQAYHFDCWARCYPAVFEGSGLDHWNQTLCQVAFRFTSHYFGGLASARHELEPLPGGESLQELASALRLGFAGLEDARKQFFSHRDVDRLLLAAVQPIDFILKSTAFVCGFLEAKDTSMARNSAAGSFLSDIGMWDWCNLFAQDLRRNYEKRNRWTSITELHQLSRHIERHLWKIGVTVSKTESGYWIDVLEDERMPFMNQLLSG